MGAGLGVHGDGVARVAHGIADQVEQGARDQARIADVVRGRKVGVDGERELPVRHVVGNVGDHAVEPFPDRHTHQHQVRGPLLQPAQGQQLRDQLVEFAHVTAQGIEAGLALRFRHRRLQQRDAELQPRDRRLQLVRNAVHHLALVLDRVLDALGHVVELVREAVHVGTPVQMRTGGQPAAAEAARRLLQSAQVAPQQPAPEQDRQQRGNSDEAEGDDLDGGVIADVFKVCMQHGSVAQRQVVIHAVGHHNQLAIGQVAPLLGTQIGDRIGANHVEQLCRVVVEALDGRCAGLAGKAVEILPQQEDITLAPLALAPRHGVVEQPAGRPTEHLDGNRAGHQHHER